MPKNFDELLTQDRTFTVRDQTFSFIDARPEALSSFNVDTNGDDNAAWGLMDAQIKFFLTEEDGKRWDELRARQENPVTIRQLVALLTWLMEEQTGRPTETPSPSEPGRGASVPSSRAKSR